MMSPGLTIAEFVQQVLYAIYKVRLDVVQSDETPDAFHADTDKFQEVVFEANFILQEFQKDMDWNFLREKICFGTAKILSDNRISEFKLPDNTYKVSTGFNDAVRLHDPTNPQSFLIVPYTSPRSGAVNDVQMFNSVGAMNAPDNRLRAFVVGDTLTFNRPFTQSEVGLLIETDIIRRLEPLHICDANCHQPCPDAYEAKVFTDMPDPYYLILRTAVKRAEADPSVSDRVMALTDDASKMLSAIRENDSSKTMPDTYQTSNLGFIGVM